MRADPRARRRANVICASLIATLCAFSAAWTGVHASSNVTGIGDVEGSGGFKVGHLRFPLTLTSSDGKVRPIDVEAWYPAAREEWAVGEPTAYRSRLWGVTLSPSTMDPLRFETVSTVAREGVAVKSGGPYPLVLHSHGTNGQPFDVAEVLEIVASHGYVVAAPWHTGNNNDDLRADAVNAAVGRQLLPCQNGSRLPQRCLDANVGRTIADRVLDLKAVQENIDALPDTNIGALLNGSVDTSNVAIFGYSRGGVAAMAAAGGSLAFGVTPMDSRLKGIFAWAGGTPIVMGPVDVHLIDRPAFFVTSTGDQLIPAADMKSAYNEMPTRDKAIFQLNNATHGSIRSNTCAEMQSAGAVQVSNLALNPPQPTRAFLEINRLNSLLSASAVPTGTAYTYCEYSSFTTPVDITGLRSSIPSLLPMPPHVPTQLSTVDCVRATDELLLSFLHVVLNPSGGAHFSDGGFLNPQFALGHETAFATAEAAYLPSEQDHDNLYAEHGGGSTDADLEPLGDYDASSGSGA
jgi:dienelactone hydrolase